MRIEVCATLVTKLLLQGRLRAADLHCLDENPCTACEGCAAECGRHLTQTVDGEMVSKEEGQR